MNLHHCYGTRQAALLENLTIMSTESLTASTRLSTSSLDTLVEETLLSPGDSGEAMEASSNSWETQTDEVQHTASACAPHQEQEGDLRLTERPKPKRLSGAARRRKRKAMAQASSDGGPAGAEGSASTLPAGTIPPKRTMDPGDTPEEVRPPFKKRKRLKNHFWWRSSAKTVTPRSSLRRKGNIFEGN